MNRETEYIPGVCNINPIEVRRRRAVGLIGLAIVAALLCLLFVVNAPVLFRLIIFIPAFVMATGFLQANAKFCVGYASAGMQHTGSDSRRIEDEDALKLDKQRARKINIQALLVAAVITGIILLLSI